MIFRFKTYTKKHLAILETPHSIYLKIRDEFPFSILLESATQAKGNDYSYICCNPIAAIEVENEVITETYPDGHSSSTSIQNDFEVINRLSDFCNKFKIDDQYSLFDIQGLFGYIGYDAIRYFETVKIKAKKNSQKTIADLKFSLYSNIIVFDHFTNTCFLIELIQENDEPKHIEALEKFINNKHSPVYPFKITSKENANSTDADFLQNIKNGMQHCYDGDVFQLVLSRRFSIDYMGDDFNVYRALRSINPSPYLFYFDYGSYRIFGASPEAQLKIKNNIASIHPIAGTYRRTGNEDKDQLLVSALRNDKKENAEHVMLVDLARNDLSKNYRDVEVSVFKEIQKFSHVIHIVSEVIGTNAIDSQNYLKVMTDTFPAGTLTGAPKYRAMELIDAYETEARGFYGGSIGFLGFNGKINQAIMIRTFLSKGNTLHYQAGAGITASSIPKNELQEVNNKLEALRTTLKLAQNI